jgi:ATP-dependent helicase/nuclease subunit A
MTEAVPKDSAARSQAVADCGSVLVQAPAGSGKTTLLTQRYLRLLATVDAPEDILALTFTRRAAEEMRERVIGALQAASLPRCPSDLNVQTWMLAGAARSRLRELDIDVERHPSRLRIETIDSFNAWLAAQLPITSGAGGHLELSADARPLYEEAARRALAHEDAFREAVDRVLAVGDQRWRELVELIADMLPSRDRWLRLLVGRLQAASALDEPQLARVRRHFDEDLALLVTRALQNAHDALGGAIIADVSALLRGAARRVGAERPEWNAWAAERPPLRPHPSDLDRWRALADVFLTKGNKLRRRFTRTEGFPAQCAEHSPMTSLLEDFAQRPQILSSLLSLRALPDPRYGDDDWARVRDVAQVLVLAAAELDQVFRERGMVDFPAVAMAALRALGTADSPTDLGLRLDYRLKHLLLDEFQDTSSAQLDLMELLTAGWQRGDGRSVFCVGDPMQSIYGFRQAEVRAFLELAEKGIGQVQFEVQRLSANFRSDRVLVEWVNQCFEQLLPREDDRERGAIAFRPSFSAVPLAGTSAVGVKLRGFGARADEALAVAELVQARLALHPEWRIAILVRARTHAREIAHSLRAHGIAFRAVDIEPLQDRPAVRDLVMLSCALLHWADRAAWLAVLRAPWAGLALADLLIIARASPVIWDAMCDEAVLEKLSGEGKTRCRRLRDVLEPAFRVQSHTSIARWVERTWLALGGPACAADARELGHVRAVFARLRELERRGLPDAADMVRRFADLYADGGPAGTVEIMTIHRAKGLEFDLVIVPALDRPIRATRSQLLLMHPFARTGRDGMVMAARPAIGTDKNRLFEFLRRQARDSASLEAERLLYVACTRAKSELHLTATVGVREEPDELLEEDADEAADAPAAAGKPSAGSLLAVLWTTKSTEFTPTAMPSEEDGAPPSAASGLRGGPLRRVPCEWSSDEVSSSALDGAPAAADLREESPEFDWAGETARRVGSLVHAELQVMDVAASNEAAIRARDAHFRRWLTLHGVPAARLSEAAERVVAALVGVHRDPRGRWILRKGYRDDFREHAVSGTWRGEVVRAVFDRTFIDESGVRWVIDYKTSQHIGGGLEEFLDREVERYRPQLERYAMLARKLGPEPVRVGLYFPLMGAWREC